MSLLVKAGITKLSELEIDAAKDWAAKKIENLGAPDSDDDAPRRDTIDTKIGDHTTPDAHHEAITPAQVDTKVAAEASARDAAILAHKNVADAHHTKLFFTEMQYGSAHKSDRDDEWRDWDLSSFVPAGATSVFVTIRNRGTTTLLVGTRKKGTMTIRDFDIFADTLLEQVTECDANRVIETYAEIKEDVEFYVIGWWI